MTAALTELELKRIDVRHQLVQAQVTGMTDIYGLSAESALEELRLFEEWIFEKPSEERAK